jgi:hypothetical protein
MTLSARLSIALCGLALAACQEARTSTLPSNKKATSESYGYAEQIPPTVDVPGCIGEGGSCETSACCSGLFCSNVISVYLPGTCTAPLADGEFCTDDGQCANGLCIDSFCRAEVCLGYDEECYNSEVECCDGTLCLRDWSAYGLARCAYPQADGAFCMENVECASAICVDNVCRSECSAAEGFCYGEVVCCPGLFCDLDENAYGVGHCIESLASGEFCQSDQECTSGACEDNLCAE